LLDFASFDLPLPLSLGFVVGPNRSDIRIKLLEGIRTIVLWLLIHDSRLLKTILLDHHDHRLRLGHEHLPVQLAKVGDVRQVVCMSLTKIDGLDKTYGTISRNPEFMELVRSFLAKF
jgi:hypothetical protein